MSLPFFEAIAAVSANELNVWVDEIYNKASALLLTALVYLLGRRQTEKERFARTAAEIAQLKAEAEVAEQRRRSLLIAPYFALCSERFNMGLMPTENAMRQYGIHPTSSEVLSVFRKEVAENLAQGRLVNLLVENRGSAAAEIQFSLDGEPSGFDKVTFSHGPICYAIRYPYSSEKRGQKQTLKFTFLALDGGRDVHTYETIHGFRHLLRLDPT